MSGNAREQGFLPDWVLSESRADSATGDVCICTWEAGKVEQGESCSREMIWEKWVPGHELHRFVFFLISCIIFLLLL